jgi:hypothetical protein
MNSILICEQYPEKCKVTAYVVAIIRQPVNTHGFMEKNPIKASSPAPPASEEKNIARAMTV